MFLLFIVFLVLKLTEIINWSWWWITAPLWGPVAIFFAVWLGIIIFYVITALIVTIFNI